MAARGQPPARQPPLGAARAEPPDRPAPPPPTGRLFSNLDTDLRHAPGSVAGAAALVAGTTVGAGILALPSVTAPVGPAGAAVAVAGAWAFSLATGLLLAEVNLSALCALGRGGVSIGDMADVTLGSTGQRAAQLVYVGLHVSLLVAYLSRGGAIVAAATHLPYPLAAAVFGGILAAPCALLPAAALDAVNGAAVLAVVAVFITLLTLAAPTVDVDALLTAPTHWEALPRALPTITLAFVFQNVVPVVSSSLEGDAASIRTALTLGTAVPAAMFLAWTAAVLGSADLLTAGGGGDPLAALSAALTPPGATLVTSFSLLAIGPSYIGFVLGLTDFFARELRTPARSPLPYAATLAPPYLGALLAPDAFEAALSAAGTYGVLTLFCLLPVGMVAASRARAPAVVPPLAPGGSATLVLVAGAATAIIVNETVARVAGVVGQ